MRNTDGFLWRSRMLRIMDSLLIVTFVQLRRQIRALSVNDRFVRQSHMLVNIVSDGRHRRWHQRWLISHQYLESRRTKAEILSQIPKKCPRTNRPADCVRPIPKSPLTSAVRTRALHFAQVGLGQDCRIEPACSAPYCARKINAGAGSGGKSL